jgi:N-acylneuraminate cytidylyltransferase
MVSTDDSGIAKVAQSYGAKIPFIRSKRNSDDFATTADVILEVLEEYEKLGKKFDYFCCIYPTAPFTSSDKLKKAFKLLTNEQSDSVIPVVQFSYPIQRAFKITKNMELEYIWPENINKRSQDLESAYHDVGQFYWAKTETFLKEKTLACGKTKPFILKESEVQDIDNKYDWELAEIKFSKFYSHV